MLALVPAPAQAQEAAARLYSAEGAVEGLIAPAADWTPIEAGQSFQIRDGVRTLEQSRAAVRFASGYLLRMNEKTNIILRQPAGKTSEEVQLSQGSGYFFSRKPRTFPAIRTPQVSASVRGTEFVVTVDADRTIISVLEGQVHAENSLGAVDLGAGEQALVRTGAAPVKQVLVRPLDAVQWGLYYPAVLDTASVAELVVGATAGEEEGFRALEAGELDRAAQAFQGTTAAGRLGRALVAYRRGDITAANSALGPAPQQATEPAATAVFRAALSLARGQVEEAARALDRAEASLGGLPSAEQQKKASAAVAAQKSVIALVRNDKAAARELAATATRLDEQSAAAALASSYVAQADFNLDQALEWLSRAAERAPTAALPRARLAELLLGFGQRDEALAEAAAALKLDPGDAYTLTVKGFAELTGYRTGDAEQLFDRAIAQEPGLALAWLGKGLAQIRAGELQSGREQLEKAVHLDPAVSLYRSYLGKAYYEADDYDLSAREYDRAIALDPNDPTPYLYRSFLNLAEHRPVLALKDLRKSQERNENRAVFRSRLLLDQDAGTRSTSLGEIYSRVGFNELARIEAVRALNRDYSNYSAHFLLADLYRNSHLNSRAQITENLLGRLLSPPTFNANNINIGGEASLNDYTSLFDRPFTNVTVTGTADSQLDRLEGRADVTTASDTLGVNLGYAYSNREGFRRNDFQREHQVFNLGQYALTQDDTLVWDAAYTVRDNGDTLVTYDPYAEDEDFDAEFDGALVRGGYHHRFGPGVHLIGQAFYNYGSFDQHDQNNADRLTFFDVTDGGLPLTDEPFNFDGLVDERTEIEQHLGRADLQLIWDTELVSVVVGGSARAERLDSKDRATITDPGSEAELAFVQGFGVASSDESTLYSHREFLYSTWHLTDTLDLDAGVVYSMIKLNENAFFAPFVDERFERDEVSPKAGLVWHALPGTTLRFSYSQTLDRTQRGGIGPIEPTFVGGFNTVFDGVRGSEQELYAAGIDQELGDSTFIGASYQRREVDAALPFIAGGLTFDRLNEELMEATLRSDQSGGADIDTARAYLYQVLSDRITGTIDYAFERFEEVDPFPETQTNRAQLQLNYFHPNGMFGFGRAVFRYQERAGQLDLKETNDFWILDAGVGYELAHQHGAFTLRFQNILDRSFKYAAITDEQPVFPEFGALLDFAVNF